MNSIPPTSPLAEASPNSLEEFFSRNPRDMIREDRAGAKNIETIVRELRRQRERWKLDEVQGATKARVKKPKADTATTEELLKAMEDEL